MKLLDQPRLPDARLAGDEDELAFAGTRALPAPTEAVELLLASDERREHARAASPAAAARAYDAIERDRSRHAFEPMRAAVFRDEQPRDLALNACGDDDRTRFGEGLHPRSDIGRLAEHCAGRVHHDLAGFQADARHQLRRVLAGVPGVELVERPWMASAARTARSASFSCACG